METNFLFTEKQSFRQWWLVTMLAALNLLFMYACIQQIGMGIQFGDKPMSNAGLLVTTVVMLVFTAAFLNMGLTTKIAGTGIYYRFSPFHIRYKFYSWTDILAWQIRKYEPIREFGGWGLKGNSTCTAYTVSGDTGLEITLQNGKKIMIGTVNPADLDKAIRAALNLTPSTALL